MRVVTTGAVVDVDVPPLFSHVCSIVGQAVHSLAPITSGNCDKEKGVILGSGKGTRISRTVFYVDFRIGLVKRSCNRSS